MEPTIATLLTPLARLSAAGLSGALNRRLLRAKVAWRVHKRARGDSIDVTLLAIYGWLGRRDVRDQLDDGGLESVESAVGNLAWRIAGSSTEDAIRVVTYVLDEYLRALPTNQAIAASTARSALRIANTSAEIRSDIASVPDAIRDQAAAFDRDLLEFHPWRTFGAKELDKRWPAVRHLAHTLASSRNRGPVLKEWLTNPPVQLSHAPAEAWTWLGELASDYAQREDAVAFYKLGISSGAPAGYWWARAALALDQTQDEVEMRVLLENAGTTHPLSRATLLLLDGAYVAAEKVLFKWAPDQPADRALRAMLRSTAAMGQGEMDRSIEILEEAARADPDASSVSLKAAEMILARARFGESVSVLGDYARARQLALCARDSRRRWAGDSVAAVLVALKATAFAGDHEGAWRLLTAAPEGEATSAEASDPKLIGERATLAALTGKLSTALELLDDVEDKHVMSMVRGWVAHAEGDSSLASDHWLEAWRHAGGDLDRIQAATAMAPLGGAMPDLGELAERHPDRVAHIQTIHAVMSAPGERVSLLRARAHESEQLTMLLVEVLNEGGDLHGAAQVLREGGLRWKDPLMLKMSANRLLHAGDLEGALGCCADALLLAGGGWAGEFDTLGIMFDAQQALTRHTEALLTARRMVEVAPDNLDARWAFVQCLVRNGDHNEAWSALKHKGEPVNPRTPHEVRTWIGLLSKFDTSTLFLSRVLTIFNQWTFDEELQGLMLLSIHRRARPLDLAPAEINVLQNATREFLSDHPNSSVFRGIFVGPDNNPLERLEAELKKHAPGAHLVEIETRIRNGKLPLGLGAEAFNRSYTECAIIRIAGLVYSDTNELSASGRQAAEEAIGSPVTLDPSAAVTLSRIDRATAETLIGSFAFIDSTVDGYQDALRAQESLAMKSTMSIHLSKQDQRIVVSEISVDLAEGRSSCADRVVSLLRGARRVNWPRLRHLQELGEQSTWLSALDYSIESRESFWCDDYLLRQVALEKDVSTFSTVDLLRHLVRIGRLEPDVARVAEAVLLTNFHVDLGVDEKTMRLAASLDRWAPGGVAVNLSRPASWNDSTAAFSLFLEAVAQNAKSDPQAVQEWTRLAAEGLIRSAGDNSVAADRNVRLLLAGAIGAADPVSALLPYLIAGIRLTLDQFPGTVDPLADLLKEIHARMIPQFGHPRAAQLLLGIVSNCAPADQDMAAGIILTMPA